MTFVSYAQNFEDVLLWRALGHVQNGFYVDIGAQHPEIDSVSQAFYQRGWRGIHVEPSAQYAALLRANRPDETVVEAALSTQSGTLHYFEIPSTGLGTADPAIASAHRERGFKVVEHVVPCTTLDEMLAPQAGRDIHWMKIDVEGHESQVIDGWDAKRFRPWIVVIEATAPLEETPTFADWEAKVIDRGYRFAYFDGLNRFYVADEHAELMSSLDRPANVFDDFAVKGTASNSFARELAADSAKAIETERKLTRAREVELQRSKARHAATRAALRQARVEAAALELRLAAREEELARVDTTLTSVYASKSWRLTLPLRQSVLLLRNLKSGLRRRVGAGDQATPGRHAAGEGPDGQRSGLAHHDGAAGAPLTAQAAEVLADLRKAMGSS